MIIDENNNARPFLAECAFCGQGMLRFWFINGTLSVLCDECELYWDDIRAVAKNPKIPATGTLDESQINESGAAATKDEIIAAKFGDLVSGYSA